jgi:hypothetical protein
VGRISKIDRLGLGLKIIAYASTGMPHDEILEKVEQEHPGTHLTLHHVSRYLLAHNASNAIALPSSTAIQSISIEAFKVELLSAINEARSKYTQYRDDPKAGWAWFKHYLESLDRMGKAVGGYLPDSQVNVGVRVDALQTRESVKAALEAKDEADPDRIAAILDVLSDLGVVPKLPAPVDGRRCEGCPHGPKPLDERMREYQDHFEKALEEGQDPQAQSATGEKVS